MTDDQLNEIEARESAATIGPWTIDDEEMFDTDQASIGRRLIGDEAEEEGADFLQVFGISEDGDYIQPNREDAAFITQSRTDVPALVAEVRRLQAELDAAVEHASSLIVQRNEARDWAEKTVAEVAAARVVTCIYCGEGYSTGTPTSQDERLTAHIKVCEKHPMRALGVERDHYKAALEHLARGDCFDLVTFDDKPPEHAGRSCQAYASDALNPQQSSTEQPNA